MDAVPPYFTSDEAVIHGVRALMPMTMVFCILDAQQALLSGILIGVGAQMVAAPIIFVSYWAVGLPVGLCFGFGYLVDEPYGLRGLWVGMLVGVVCHVVSYSIYALRLDW